MNVRDLYTFTVKMPIFMRYELRFGQYNTKNAYDSIQICTYECQQLLQ